ncbi:MAG: hypothetical protein P8Q95_06850 [Candidatus Poseidoniaceae archaeon]|nr:hypothetical protein [Candidatus Poseidoniaceae archaeon]
MARSPFNEIFELSPVRIELSFAHWGENKVAIIDFDSDTDNLLQVISGLNGSGKTITLEAIKKFTNVFTKPSNSTLKAFETFSRNVDLRYMMVEFRTVSPVRYIEQKTRKDGVQYPPIDPHTLPFGYCLPDNYGEIDNHKFEDYFGFTLNPDEWLYSSTTISKFVEFTLTDDEINWRFKQAGSVKVNHRPITNAALKSGELYWNEGWKKPTILHEPSKLAREFLLEIVDIEANRKTWGDESGLFFEDLERDCHDYNDVAITIVRGASYLEVKHAYLFDTSFFESISSRFNDIQKLKRIVSDKDGKTDFDNFFESLKTSSNYPSIYEKYEEMTSSKFKFSMFHHDKVENMNTQEFIFHLTTVAPQVYILFQLDEISYISLVLIFLCDGADFLKDNSKPLTAGQRRVISLAHQWHETPKWELLLMDEPEISLHISWQRNFIMAFSNLNKFISNTLLQTATDDKFLEDFKDDPEFKTPYEILELFLNHAETPARKILIATHSPDIIYNHQELCTHIPPMDGD